MTTGKRKICFLRPDRAGDALMSLPVLRAARSLLADSELHLLASEHNASLFEKEPGFTLHVLPTEWNKLKKDKLEAVIGSIVGSGFDKAVSLLCDPFEDLERLLLVVSAREKFRVSRGPVPRGITELKLPASTPAQRSETLNIALLVEQALGIELVDRVSSESRVPLRPQSDDDEAMEKMGTKNGRWLGFCPIASLKGRSVPIAKWGRFIHRVTKNTDFDRFFLLGNPADYALLEKLRGESQRKEATELCFPSNFRALGAYLVRLDGVVAVDSGPLHYARALGVKSLGILSGGDVKRWFSSLSTGDYNLPRGLLGRFPSSIEMLWAYDRWRALPPLRT